jgi:hypothetical protein
VRTSALGWRIVAIGVLFLIFGISGLLNQVGPGWFSLLMMAIGTVVVIYGRNQ